MPISEDELESRIHSSMAHSNEYRYSALSKAEQRRNNKPIMEKRRRARINQCLNELKTLILDATNKDPARHTKLEKADILEMTVKHLQSIQRQHLSAAVASDPTVVHKFKTGFNECAGEVSRYIGGLEGIDNGVKQRLILHLTSCITNLQPAATPSVANPFNISNDIRIPNTEDLNNNDAARFQAIPGLQLIPSRLPSGELALLLPNSSSLSSLFPNTFDLNNRSHASAFTPVSKDVKPSGNSTTTTTTTVKDEPKTSTDNSNSEVSSTSNDGSTFKPPGTPSKSILPSGSFTSSSSSLLIPVTELNAQYKKDQYTGLALQSERSNLFKPLTVYTDPCYDLTSPSKNSSPLVRKSPLDFSIKKDTEEAPSSSDPVRVMRKRPLEDLPCNVPIPPTKALKIDCDKENDVDKPSIALPNHSGGSIVNQNDGMWRPW
ncbi:hairy/enhancer-of-split related with YRPW motif protein 2-like [Planococcus citri]|uniref:hairy/enhancer-of-split related with YRPW motif protein 2-like n=1 Tax=Planococcus citri TaxID=170843 RepID=UPI0031F741B3